jgi:hypothetical protein
VPGIPAVYLFGSRVRGDHRKDSDVDFVCFSINGDLTKLPRNAGRSVIGQHEHRNKKARDSGITCASAKSEIGTRPIFEELAEGVSVTVALIGQFAYAADPPSNPPFEFTRQCQFLGRSVPPLQAPDLSGRARPGSAVTITMIGWSRTQSDRI